MSLINKILLTTEGLSTIAAGLIGPIYAIFVEKIHGDVLDAAGAYAAFTLTMGLIIYLLGKWEDHHKHDRDFIIVGYLISAFGFASYIFVANPPQLLMTQVILGLGLAIRVPAYDSLYSKAVVHKHFALAWGDWEATDAIATGIAALLGGLVANFYGFKALLVFMFVVSLLALSASLYLFKAKARVSLE